MSKFFAPLFALSSFLLSGGPLSASEHTDIRDAMVSLQLSQLDHDGILVLGDSIMEAWLGEPFGRCQMINGGLGGGGVKDVLKLVGTIASNPNRGKLKEAIIAIGVNDARRQLPKSADYVANWRKDYETLISQVKALVPMVAITTILPVENGLPLGTTYFDPATIDQLNQSIRQFAAANPDVELMDLNKKFQSISWQGHYTVDGVHPMAKTYRIISKELVSGLSGYCIANSN